MALSSYERIISEPETSGVGEECGNKLCERGLICENGICKRDTDDGSSGSSSSSSSSSKY